jgi:DNA-binding FadR family transcriptional regulator
MTTSSSRIPTTAELADVVRIYLAARGYAPSHREIAARLGTSLRVVRSVLRAAEAAGMIRRLPGLPRAITVVDPARPCRSPTRAAVRS